MIGFEPRGNIHTPPLPCIEGRKTYPTASCSTHDLSAAYDHVLLLDPKFFKIAQALHNCCCVGSQQLSIMFRFLIHVMTNSVMMLCARRYPCLRGKSRSHANRVRTAKELSASNLPKTSQKTGLWPCCLPPGQTLYICSPSCLAKKARIHHHALIG